MRTPSSSPCQLGLEVDLRHPCLSSYKKGDMRGKGKRGGMKTEVNGKIPWDEKT